MMLHNPTADLEEDYASESFKDVRRSMDDAPSAKKLPTEEDTMARDIKKQKTMPLSSQSEDKTVVGSKRRAGYEESESALSPPIDSQQSMPEVNEVREEPTTAQK